LQNESRGGRQAAENEILINKSEGETRVAVLEQGSFNELHIERDSDRIVTGTVALGRVTRVLPGMQAAFVDIGLEKAAFLYAGDYLSDTGLVDPDLLEDEPAPRQRRRGRNGGGGRQQPPSIDTLVREGQEIVVQVAKDPIGTKGARITSHVSIAGRHLVLTPWSPRIGISRRIESDRERRRLREILTRLRPPELGFIIRTAGEGLREADLEADVRYLTSVWEEIQRNKEEMRAPAQLYAEPSLPLRVIRDMAHGRMRRIVIDDAETHEKMAAFLDRFVADPKPRLEHYTGKLPIFDHFGVEPQIDSNLGKKVWLKSGGYLIVDQSEALTAIDVNTGRFVGKRDLEETVLKTNLEAVKEVVSQLRFRNIGGLIIIDLIDMEIAENREKVYRALREALRGDKAKTNILKISELGLVEMTRKRTRENLVQQLCETCSYCEGRGYVLSAESVAYKVLREIRKDLPRFCGRRIAISVHPSVAEMLLTHARKAVARLGEELGREIEIRARPGQHQEQFEVEALDAGPPVELALPWLRERKERHEPPPAGPAEDAGETAPASEEAPAAALAGAAAAASALPVPLEPDAEPLAPAEAPGASEAVGPADAAEPAEAALAGAPEGVGGAVEEGSGAPARDALDEPEEEPILPPLARAEES
jgi:ribonuclease G